MGDGQHRSGAGTAHRVGEARGVRPGGRVGVQVDIGDAEAQGVTGLDIGQGQDHAGDGVSGLDGLDGVDG